MNTITQPAPVARAAAFTPKPDAWGPIVTVMKNLKEPEKCFPIRLSKVAEAIRNNAALKKNTDEIRKLRSEGREADAAKLKKTLPAFIAAGEFLPAAAEGFQRHSGLQVADFDKIPAGRLEPFRKWLAADPHTVLVFTSPSLGLKWVFATKATDAATHKKCYARMTAYLRLLMPDLAQCLDQTGKDLARKCFLAHDPDVRVIEPTESFEPEAGLGPAGAKLLHSITVSQPPSLPSLSCPPDTHAPHAVSVGGLLSSEEWVFIQKSVAALVPTKPHDTDRNIFDLGRLPLRVEHDRGNRKGSLPLSELNKVFMEWIHQTNPAFLSQSVGDYRIEFHKAYASARVPLGIDPVEIAWQLAKSERPPDEALTVFPDNDEGGRAARLIFGCAYQLSKLSPTRKFYLAVRSIPALATRDGMTGTITIHMTTSRVLGVMETRFIRRLKTGGRSSGLANEYVFLQLDSETASPISSSSSDKITV